MRFPFTWLLTLTAALCITGCGPEGGTAGDTNDPAIDGTDTEQLDLGATEVGS